MDLETARHFATFLAGTDDAGEPFDPGEPPVIAGIEIREPIGSGASGLVWLGRTAQGTAVAVKHLRPGMGSESNERGWRELEALEEIDHPCVPKLLDYGTDRGRLYFVTEFVDGEPLDRYARNRDLGLAQRVELLARIAAAVGSLHEHGVIHRDLKPGNILITADGSPRIIDLGLASLLSTPPGHTLTQPESVLGTPAFMAPEQARGEVRNIGTRSDVYALGAIGFLLLLGRTPHDLDGLTLFEALRAVGERSLDARFPRGLAAILETACAHDPARRYATASQLHADLQRWLNREPVLAGEASAWHGTVRWIARHPFATTWSLCALILVLMATASGLTVRALTSQPIDFFESDSGNAVFVTSRARTRIGAVYEPANPASRLHAYRVNGEPRSGEWFLLLQGNTRDPLGFPELALVDPDRPAAPSWYFPDRMTPPDRVLPDGTVEVGEAFTPMAPDHVLRIWDLYPDIPGDEIIVAVRNNAQSETRLCVLGLDGEVLASIWHLGHIHSIWPTETEGEVLFTATHHGDDTAWNERTPLVGRVRLPRGQVLDRWISIGSGDAQTDLVWALRAARPTHAATDSPAPLFVLGSPDPNYPPGTVAARLTLDAPALRGVQKIWHIDPKGHPTGEAYLSDEARRHDTLGPLLSAIVLEPAVGHDSNLPE